MSKIKTAKGKTFECDYLNAFGGLLNISVVGAAAANVKKVFSDPEEIKSLQYEGQTITKYKEFAAVYPGADCTRVVLKEAE